MSLKLYDGTIRCDLTAAKLLTVCRVLIEIFSKQSNSTTSSVVPSAPLHHSQLLHPQPLKFSPLKRQFMRLQFTKTKNTHLTLDLSTLKKEPDLYLPTCGSGWSSNCSCYYCCCGGCKPTTMQPQPAGLQPAQHAETRAHQNIN